jgi:ribonuclease HI
MKSKPGVNADTRPTKQLTVFVDGAGMRPDGTNSRIAWLQLESGRKLVKRIDGLTNNQAEYRALRSAVKNAPIGSHLKIYSDSQLVVQQFNQRWSVKDPQLDDLLFEVCDAIQARELQVSLDWIPRAENLAGKLL